MKDLLIVIQGSSDFVPLCKKWYKNNQILFSTWKGQESKYESGDLVIFNDPPNDAGPANFWMQQKSTIEGLKKAKDLGYKRVLKIRSDMFPNYVDKFLSTFKEDKLNLFCWHAHEVYPKCSGYFIDYFMCGNVDDLISLWSINNAFCAVPEIMITWQYISMLRHIPIHYIFNEIDSQNDIYWVKRNIFLSSYKDKKIDPYNLFTFIIDSASLNESYLNFLR